MLAAVRNFAKSWVATALIGLLIVSFAIFGVHDVFKGKISDAVVSAGTRQVSSADFKRMFDNAKKQAEQRSGQPISYDDAVAHGLDQQLLTEVAANEAYMAVLAKDGLRPSAQLIVDQIRKNPQFFDPISGKFDQKAYQSILAENGLTPAKAESIFRDEIADAQYSAGAVAGFRAPRIYTALYAALGLENRNLTYFVVDPAKVDKPGAPTDAQLTAFMKENAAQLTKPELRGLTIVRFSTKALTPSMTADPKDLEKLYNFRKDSLSTPEKRSMTVLLAPDAKAAAAAAARLGKGEDPAAVARALGKPPVQLADTPTAAVPDRKVADAAFALAEGQVSQPIQGELGWAVVKLGKITPGKAKTFEEAKPELEAQLKKDAAQQKIYDVVQKYEDARSAGANLSEAAAKVGASALSLAPVSQSGADGTGKPVPGLSEKMLKAAFALPEGGESDVEDEGGGEYYAVRVEKILPPALPGLDEVRAPLTRYFLMRETAKLMEAKANELAARVRKGESVEAVAAAFGAPVSHAIGVDRVNARQNQALSPDLLNKLFGAKAGDVLIGQANPFGFAVGKVDAIQPGPTAQAARIAEAQRPQVTMQLLQEMGERARLAAGQLVKVRTDQNKARSALGVAPIDTKKAKDQPKTPERAG